MEKLYIYNKKWNILFFFDFAEASMPLEETWVIYHAEQATLLTIAGVVNPTGRTTGKD